MTRQQLIDKYRHSVALTKAPHVSTLTANQVQREYARQKRTLERYADLLPSVPVGRCPICGQVLEYRFDPAGLDGMWWNKDGIVRQRPPEEEHHRVTLGAVDFHGRLPIEAKPNGKMLPGPGAPFVVPRLFAEFPEMIAVLSCAQLPHGDTAYLISYFNPAPVNPFRLHQSWAREAIMVEGADDYDPAAGWGLATDPWDFELQPWIDAGKLKWIEPGDAGLVLRDSGPCPYLNLPGVRAPQSFQRGQMSLLPLPDGTPFDPFD